MSKEITQETFFKSLEKLEALATGSDMSKSQICTGGNSEVSSWPGGNKSSVSQTGAGVGADEDGEYNAGKARKSIAEKVMKGQALTADEVGLLASDMNKSQDEDEDDRDGRDRDPREGKDDDEKDDDKADEAQAAIFGGGKEMGKSMGQAISENETLQSGIEVSSFLLEFAKSFAFGLDNVKRELASYVDQRLGQFESQQGDFNKSLAEAVVNIGHGIGSMTKGIEAVAQAPAAAPKSQLRSVQALSKGQGEGQQFSKSQIADALTDMLEKGRCTTLDVVKFDTTGELAPQLRDEVAKSLSGSR